jgi:acetyl-CoA acyltransferase
VLHELRRRIPRAARSSGARTCQPVTNEPSATKGLQLCKPGEGGGKLIGGDQVRVLREVGGNPSCARFRTAIRSTRPGSDSAPTVLQLHGMTEKRQVEGALTALRHNVGLGGGCEVMMYA